MKEFEVVIEKIERYFVVVRADSEEDAKERAEEMVEESPEKYHDDSDANIEAYEVESDD